MNIDSLTLAAVAYELRQTVASGKVERIMQPDPLTIVLSVCRAGQRHNLLISCEPEAPRLYLTSQPRANPPAAPAFCMLLRKYLDGAWLEAVEQPFGIGERVLRFVFAAHDQARYSLWAELMGKHSNVVFTDDSRQILGALKRVTTQMSRYRPIRPGLAYVPPPAQKGARRDPFAPSEDRGLPQATLATAEEAQAWLSATFTAVSPLMAQESVARAPGPPYTQEGLWYALNDLLNAARLAEWAPVAITDGKGAVESAYPIALKTVPAERQQRMKSMSAALDRAYAELGRRSVFQEEKKSLLSSLARAIKAREREMIDVEEGLANAERAEEYKETAHLIQASVGSIALAAAQVELADYFAEQPGAVRMVALDPKLSASENAERYISKYRKARNSRDALQARRLALGEALAALTGAQEAALAAQTAEEVTAISEEVGDRIAARLNRQARTSSEEPAPFAGHRIRTYRSVDGWEILVGENAASNDFLTTRVASPSDIWLHARAIPSAHAVIRTGNRPASVSPAALKLAAEQVAQRSQAKHARMVPVDYTLKKYVRKPRKAAPGEVTYSNEKTLDITPVLAQDK